ncbi:MAG: hypothetical protein ISS34_03880 [Candidatus Omnitrophica bacterium]|nr:hypothetical protein [Candidatus Omnitrophota bacterium]
MKINIRKILFKRLGKKGLTFAETVIAILIAAILLVGFLQACTSSALLLRNIKYRVRAVNIAQAEIEDVTALGYSGIDMSEFTGGKQVNVIIDEGVTAASGDDVIGLMTTTVEDATSGPDNGRKIVVGISWSMLGQARSELLETVIYDYL